MNWLKPKCEHTACKRCGTVFDPIGIEKRWADMCYSCRTPLMEIDKRKDVVLAWAIANWEKLETQALEENKAKRLAYNHALNAYAKQQNNPLTSGGLYGNYGDLPAMQPHHKP